MLAGCRERGAVGKEKEVRSQKRGNAELKIGNLRTRKLRAAASCLVTCRLRQRACRRGRDDPAVCPISFPVRPRAFRRGSLSRVIWTLATTQSSGRDARTERP